MRVKRGLLGLAVLFVMFGQSSADAGASGLEMSTVSTAYADVTFSKPVTFDLDRSSFTGKGRYQGFYIESLDVAPADRFADGRNYGAVTLRDFHDPSSPGYTMSLTPGSQRSFKPGRYRVYAIADGPTTVKLVGSGLSIGRLRLEHPASSAAAVKTDILQSPVQADNRQALRVSGNRPLSLVSTLVGQFRAYAGTIGACLARTEDECGSASNTAADGGYAGYVLSPLNDLTFTFTIVYQPGVGTAPASVDS